MFKWWNSWKLCKLFMNIEIVAYYVYILVYSENGSYLINTKKSSAIVYFNCFFTQILIQGVIEEFGHWRSTKIKF